MRGNIKSALDRGDKLDNLESKAGKEIFEKIIKFYVLEIQMPWTPPLTNFKLVPKELKINFGGKMLK